MKRSRQRAETGKKRSNERESKDIAVQTDDPLERRGKRESHKRMNTE